jgi:hypothetical protein
MEVGERREREKKGEKESEIESEISKGKGGERNGKGMAPGATGVSEPFRSFCSMLLYDLRRGAAASDIVIRIQ